MVPNLNPHKAWLAAVLVNDGVASRSVFSDNAI